MPPATNDSRKRAIVMALVKGDDPKTIAFNYDCSITLVYDIRKEYFVEKWVLKRHPTSTFKLES